MKPKTAKILNWIIIILLSLQFVAAGTAKLTPAEGWVVSFERYGYPLFTIYVVGALELVAVVGFYFKKFRKAAALILIILMLGAAITHLLNDESVRSIHNTILIGLSSGLIYLQRFMKKEEVSSKPI